MRTEVPAGGHRRECLPGQFRVTGLVRVAAERVEQDGVGAEEAQILEVDGNLVDRASVQAL
jgi:hypothetical protein